MPPNGQPPQVRQVTAAEAAAELPPGEPGEELTEDAKAAIAIAEAQQAQVTQHSNPADPLARWGASASDYIAGLCLGIFGKGNAGKTTLAATAADSENGGPVLLYNCAANPHVIRSRGNNVIVKDILKFEDAEVERQKVLRAGRTFPFKTIVWDNLSELHALCLRDKYGPTTDVAWEMHSATTAMFKQFVRNWRDMSTNTVIGRPNIIFILWETPEKRKVRGIEETVAEISISGRLQSEFGGMIPFMGQLYIEASQEPWTRVLDFRPNERERAAKWQVDPNDEWAKEIPMRIFNPSLASIIDTIKGHKPWPVEKHRDPRAMRAASQEKKA